ncbi:DinB family protein [Afifella sp. IM 167]|uniref:DinB family protein n=1 Tax=Afifella sp. IM 167 TaxID=2033586 RepID=UPI001CCFE1A1|nr:DinB family protein [Afifella sp. IM 167]MBZ8131692.1 damage-inducible protein DinB [Afifella sp. IM 167]
MKAHYDMLARYNRWANKRIYAAAAALPEAELKEDRGAFFGSLFGTLTHLIVADRIWLNRFTGEGETYDRLDAMPFDDLVALEAARLREDERIVEWVEGLGDEDLAGTFTYRRVSTPDEYTDQLAPALAHFFNHQTHHRGQCHTILTGLGREGPVMDILYFQREEAVA